MGVVSTLGPNNNVLYYFPVLHEDSYPLGAAIATILFEINHPNGRLNYEFELPVNII